MMALATQHRLATRAAQLSALRAQRANRVGRAADQGLRRAGGRCGKARSGRPRSPRPGSPRALATERCRGRGRPAVLGRARSLRRRRPGTVSSSSVLRSERSSRSARSPSRAPIWATRSPLDPLSVSGSTLVELRRSSAIGRMSLRTPSTDAASPASAAKSGPIGSSSRRFSAGVNDGGRVAQVDERACRADRGGGMSSVRSATESSAAAPSSDALATAWPATRASVPSALTDGCRHVLGDRQGCRRRWSTCSRRAAGWPPTVPCRSPSSCHATTAPTTHVTAATTAATVTAPTDAAAGEDGSRAESTACGRDRLIRSFGPQPPVQQQHGERTVGDDEHAESDQVRPRRVDASQHHVLEDVGSRR